MKYDRGSSATLGGREGYQRDLAFDPAMFVSAERACRFQFATCIAVNPNTTRGQAKRFAFFVVVLLPRHRIWPLSQYGESFRGHSIIHGNFVTPC